MADDMLEVAVWCYGQRSGSYVLTSTGVEWRGSRPEALADYSTILPDGTRLERAILKTDDYRDGWITPEDGPEEWLRRLPGFLAMRGVTNARIVADSTPGACLANPGTGFTETAAAVGKPEVT